MVLNDLKPEFELEPYYRVGTPKVELGWSMSREKHEPDFNAILSLIFIIGLE